MISGTMPQTVPYKVIFTFHDGVQTYIKVESNVFTKKFERDKKKTRNFLLEKLNGKFYVEEYRHHDTFDKMLTMFQGKEVCEEIKVEVQKYTGAVNDYCTYYKGTTSMAKTKPIFNSRGRGAIYPVPNTTSKYSFICKFEIELESDNKLDCLLRNEEKEYSVAEVESEVVNGEDIIIERVTCVQKSMLVPQGYAFGFIGIALANQLAETKKNEVIQSIIEGNWQCINDDEFTAYFPSDWAIESYEVEIENPDINVLGIQITNIFLWRIKTTYNLVRDITYVYCSNIGSLVEPIGDGWYLIDNNCPSNSTWARLPLKLTGISNYDQTRALNKTLEMYFQKALADCDVYDVYVHFERNRRIYGIPIL